MIYGPVPIRGPVVWAPVHFTSLHFLKVLCVWSESESFEQDWTFRKDVACKMFCSELTYFILSQLKFIFDLPLCFFFLNMQLKPSDLLYVWFRLGSCFSVKCLWSSITLRPGNRIIAMETLPTLSQYYGFKKNNILKIHLNYSLTGFQVRLQP